MNYPIWDIPAPGLLIAAVAIVHVFVSHFAVGGGLFLVLAERKARRESDPALLAYVERHSRFFVLLTLVFGALTGVGIWFTIALVHPSATASLIASFVWGWAIEWTFFVVEIAAAMVYYYGWHRLTPAVHLRVGWIYFWAAWLSLAVINGILTFMLTPGGWVTSHGFWAGILNPTYLPGVAARTAAAVGLAGLYALLTATWLSDGAKPRIAWYAATRWVLPAAIALPITLAWYLQAAAATGVPVAEIFGAKAASIPALVQAAFTTAVSGYPIAQRALAAFLVSSTLVVLLAIVLAAWRSSAYGAGYAAVMMACGFVALGSAEWMREDLRKPFVIGHYMFVNGLRLPALAVAPRPPDGAPDRFALDEVERQGVLTTALWARAVPPPSSDDESEVARGREVFRLSCTACHTLDGYLAIRPLVRGMSVSAATAVLARLAVPVDPAGQAARWDAPNLRLTTWRGRRMPPFAGNAEERHALGEYLATLGGATTADLAKAAASATLGAATFDEKCSICHGADAEFPFNSKGRDADDFYDMIGRLPQIKDAMPPFEGTDEQRRALSEYLPTLQGGRPQGGVK